MSLVSGESFLIGTIICNGKASIRNHTYESLNLSSQIGFFMSEQTLNQQFHYILCFTLCENIGIKQTSLMI